MTILLPCSVYFYYFISFYRRSAKYFYMLKCILFLFSIFPDRCLTLLTITFPSAKISPVKNFLILSISTYCCLAVICQTKCILRREFSIGAVAATKNKIIYRYRCCDNQEQTLKFDDLTAAKNNIFTDIFYFHFLWVATKKKKIKKGFTVIAAVVQTFTTIAATKTLFCCCIC